MATLQWHQPGDKVYEAGLDRGVLYVPGKPGVPWNGLTSVQGQNDISTNEVYFDGQKINDLVTLGSWKGTLRAITYPDEFLLCEGVQEDQLGVFVDSQPLVRFGLSYRTGVGDDIQDLDAGYKIHCLWGLTAIPKEVTRQTLSLEVSPVEFEWSLSAIPQTIAGHRATAHMVIDSRDIDEFLLSDIEDILYGTATTDPQLPTLQGLANFIRKWDRLIIRDNGDGTWTAISRNDTDIQMLSATEFQITADNVVWLDDPTNSHYSISSSDKNEEDI